MTPPAPRRTLEPGGQDMPQEKRDERRAGQPAKAALAGFRMRAHPEENIPCLDRHDPLVRDRHAMRIASQILQDSHGSAERRFGIDDPLMRMQR